MTELPTMTIYDKAPSNILSETKGYLCSVENMDATKSR